MESRQFTWSESSDTHHAVFAWVPGTADVPYEFGVGGERRPIALDGFYLGTTPVTQALWQRIMGDNPAARTEPGCPIENVSWEQITARGGFLDRLNDSEVRSTLAAGDESLCFRLPSEAEWEYAARGGPHWQDDFAFSGSNDPAKVAWFGRRWRSTDQALVRLFGWKAGWRLANRMRKCL